MSPEISALVQYMTIELPQLEATYGWKTPELKGFPRCGERSYTANIDLKNYLNRQWRSAGSKSEKVEIARVVISDWGGVRNNKMQTLEKYVDHIEMSDPPMPIKGVASYSKLYSIVRPDDYVIYDARVAVCLNAVQFNCGLRKGSAFNYVPGRNNITGHAEKRTGFAYDSRFQTKSLIKRGWKRIKRDDTYGLYLSMMKECLSHFKGKKLRDLEMVLFANAESECSKAMNARTA